MGSSFDINWFLFVAISGIVTILWLTYWIYEIWPNRHVCFKATLRGNPVPEVDFVSSVAIRALSVGLGTFGALNLFMYGDIVKGMIPQIPYVSKSVLAICAILLLAYTIGTANKAIRNKIKGNE